MTSTRGGGGGTPMRTLTSATAADAETARTAATRNRAKARAICTSYKERSRSRRRKERARGLRSRMRGLTCDKTALPDVPSRPGRFRSPPRATRRRAKPPGRDPDRRLAPVARDGVPGTGGLRERGAPADLRGLPGARRPARGRGPRHGAERAREDRPSGPRGRPGGPRVPRGPRAGRREHRELRAPRARVLAEAARHLPVAPRDPRRRDGPGRRDGSRERPARPRRDRERIDQGRFREALAHRREERGGDPEDPRARHDAHGPAHGLHETERADAGLPEDRPHRRRGPAGNGEDGVRPEHRVISDDPPEVRRRLLLARDVRAAARVPHPVRRVAREPAAPARGPPLEGGEEGPFLLDAADARSAALRRRFAGRHAPGDEGPRAPAQAAARPRCALRGLPPDHGVARQGREPHAGGQRLLAGPQGTRQGARRSRHRALAAVEAHRAARLREGAGPLGPSRVGRDRAGCRRRSLPVAARVLRPGHGEKEHLRRHHRQAAQRPDRPLHARLVGRVHALLGPRDDQRRSGTLTSPLRPTHAVIDLDALASNYRALTRALPRGCSLMPVVKADAYGHGAGHVARRLAEEGAPIFAVAVVEEGLELRRAGIMQPILVMGWIGKDQLGALVDGGLTPNVHSVEQAEELRDFLEEKEREKKDFLEGEEGKGAAAGAQRSGLGALRLPLPVHLKLDTGMTRLGVLPADLPRVLDLLDAVKGRIL